MLRGWNNLTPIQCGSLSQNGVRPRIHNNNAQTPGADVELVREGAPELTDVLAYIHRGREPEAQHVQMDVTLGVYDVAGGGGAFAGPRNLPGSILSMNEASFYQSVCSEGDSWSNPGESRVIR